VDNVVLWKRCGQESSRLREFDPASHDHVPVVRIRGALGYRYASFTMSLPARLQAASSEYQKLQVDLSNAVEARQRLDAQLSENALVKKVRNPKLIFFLVCRSRIVVTASLQEFTTLTPNNLVFKLVGPVLVKQDQAEAKSNVDKRLEFIRGEMWVSQRMSRVDYAHLSDSKRIEGQLQEIEQKSEKKKMEVTVFIVTEV